MSSQNWNLINCLDLQNKKQIEMDTWRNSLHNSYTYGCSVKWYQWKNWEKLKRIRYSLSKGEQRESPKSLRKSVRFHNISTPRNLLKLRVVYAVLLQTIQLAFTCSKLTTEKLEKGMKYVHS